MYRIIVNFWFGNKENKDKLEIVNVPKCDIKYEVADLRDSCSHYLFESGLIVSKKNIVIDSFVVVPM